MSWLTLDFLSNHATQAEMTMQLEADRDFWQPALFERYVRELLWLSWRFDDDADKHPLSDVSDGFQRTIMGEFGIKPSDDLNYAKLKIGIDTCGLMHNAWDGQAGFWNRYHGFSGNHVRHVVCKGGQTYPHFLEVVDGLAESEKAA